MPEPEESATVHTEDVSVRRAPKIGSFLLVGAVVGIAIGLGISAARPAIGEYTIEQIVGLIVLVFGIVGAATGATVAILLDRRLAQRARTMSATRTAVNPAGENAETVD